jgi:hypothetical protein
MHVDVNVHVDGFSSAQPPSKRGISCLTITAVSNNDSRVMEDEIIRFCGSRVSHFKATESFAFLSALPKSPQDKNLIK